MMKVSDKNLKRFESAVKHLNSVIQDCKIDNPKCFAYLNCDDTLSLFSGDVGLGEDGDHATVIAYSTLTTKAYDW